MERQLKLLKAVEMGFDDVETFVPSPGQVWPLTNQQLALEKFNAKDGLIDDYFKQSGSIFYFVCVQKLFVVIVTQSACVCGGGGVSGILKY